MGSHRQCLDVRGVPWKGRVGPPALSSSLLLPSCEVNSFASILS